MGISLLFVLLIGSVVASPTLNENDAYTAPLWLPGGHIQTIYPATVAPTPQVEYRRERWELDDGDFIDTDWVDSEDNSAPTVVLFHGLEGNSQSHYALSLMSVLKRKKWRGVVVHFRGCSGENNRLPRAYFAGDSAEIEMALSRVKNTTPTSPVYAVGVSLGGNALLKWLGESEEHAQTLIESAAAVSAPIDLGACGRALDKGLNRLIYTPRFIASMRPKALEKAKQFPGLLDIEKIKAAKTIEEFDTHVTAKLHGFIDASDYWQKNASKPWLPYIKVPTLIMNAKNDPFIPYKSLPDHDGVSASTTLEITDEGGHVGYVNSPFPGKLNWLPEHIIHYFQQVNEVKAQNQSNTSAINN